jgi:hypothetical protein
MKTVAAIMLAALTLLASLAASVAILGTLLGLLLATKGDPPP